MILKLTASDKDTLGDHEELKTTPEVEELVFQADKDKDGTIGFTEFVLTLAGRWTETQVHLGRRMLEMRQVLAIFDT